MVGTKFDFLKEARHIMLDPRLASWIFKVAEAYDKNPIEIVEIYRKFLDSAFSDRWWIDLEKEDIEQIKRIRKAFMGEKPSVEEYLRYKTQEYEKYLAMLEAARLAEQDEEEASKDLDSSSGEEAKDEPQKVFVKPNTCPHPPTKEEEREGFYKINPEKREPAKDKALEASRQAGPNHLENENLGDVKDTEEG